MKPLSDDGGGSDEVEKRARQRLDALDSKHGLKLAGNGSSKSGKHSRMSSNGSGVKSKRSGKKRRRGSSVSEDSSSGEEDTDWSTSVGPSSESESDDGVRKSRKRRKSARAVSSSNESSSDGLTSESEDKSRGRHKTSGSREKKSGRRKERTDRKVKLKGKRSRRSESSRGKGEESVSKKSKDKTKSRDKLNGKHKKERRSKHKKEGSKKKYRNNVEEVAIPIQEDVAIAKISRTPLQDKMDAQEQQKAMIRHNAEMAKARLASGDMKRARDEQAEMQRLYGAVDWRAKKKLRSEKKRLERTIAAGNKLANLEEREMARMDAFRVAVSFPFNFLFREF